MKKLPRFADFGAFYFRTATTVQDCFRIGLRRHGERLDADSFERGIFSLKIENLAGSGVGI